MKILEVIPCLSPGGAERFVVDLCNEMSRTEDVTLLSLKSLTIGNNGFYLYEVCERVKVEEMNLKDGFHISYPLKVWRKIRSLQPDIVHFHLAGKYCILITMLHSDKIKVFQTIHNDIRNSYSSGFNSLQIKTLGRLGKLNYITISKTNFDDFCRIYPGVSNTLIYNGRNLLCKTDKFPLIKEKINKLKQNKDCLVLLHIARCTEQKNQQLLIKAFNHWIVNEANAILLMIGDGFNSDYGKALQKEACKQIVFLGTTSNVADYMYCSDAFILSSNYEGMPITAIESLLTGLPILSTPVCGVVDVVRHGQNGLLSEDWSEESFVKMLDTYNYKHKELKATAEQEMPDSPYKISRCAAEYLKLFCQ